jgi:hypothetical protein
MIKLLDLYDTIRKGQEIVQDTHWQPPNNFTAEDVKRLSELDKALDLIQEAILEAINASDVEVA